MRSLGVVLWELITLRRPWDNNEPEDTSSLEDAWIPDYEHAQEPLVQQQRITEYAIIQVKPLLDIRHMRQSLGVDADGLVQIRLRALHRSS